jgi:hypothetical protein
MTSPTNNASSFGHYLESTNEPKTLHGVQILVDDWQRQSVFGMPNPDILPQTFIDEATGQTLQDIFEQPEDASFGERTPMPSPPPTPKPKGKAKEVEEQHDDPMSDDIYEEEKPIPGLSQPKLTLAIPQEQGKGQDNLATGAAGSSHVKAPKQELKGAASRLQAIQEALKASGHLQKAQNLPNKSSHGGSPTDKIPTTVEPSTSSMTAAVEENYILDYFRFINVVNSDDDLSQLVRQSKDHADLHKGFLRHEVYRHVQRELQPFTHEAYEIQTEYTNVVMNIMDLMARQKDHKQRLQEFYERLGQSAEHAIREIPIEPFRERYPNMFNRRPAAVITENQQNRPAPSSYPCDSGRATPPNQRYDSSNPRWSGQSPHSGGTTTKEPQNGSRHGHHAKNTKITSAISADSMDISDGTALNTLALTAEKPVVINRRNVPNDPDNTTDEIPKFDASGSNSTPPTQMYSSDSRNTQASNERCK